MNAEDRDRLEVLHAELSAEVLERVDAGVCGCGCGEGLGVNPGRRRYVNARHRQRAHRHRLELEARALSVPARLSLSALRAHEPTGKRHADAQARPQAPRRRRSAPRPGVTVYLPSVALAELVERELAHVVNGYAPEPLAAGPELQPALDAVAAALKRRRRRV